MDEILKELQVTFIAEAEGILEGLESALLELDGGERNADLLNRLFRLAHNFKGSARSVGFNELAELAHKLEDVLSALKNQTLDGSVGVVSSLLVGLDGLKSGLAAARVGAPTPPDLATARDVLIQVFGAKAPAPVSPEPEVQGFGFFDEPAPARPKALDVTPHQADRPLPPVAEESKVKAQAPDEQVRVPAGRLDMLLNLVGELVVNRAILDEHRSRGTTASPDAVGTLAYMSKLISDVQGIALSLRLVQIRPLFQKLRRAARDVAQQVERDVEFIVEGEHVELDKSVLDRMSDPLTHMIRNAVDHGVESPDAREAAGKSRTATVRVAAIEQEDRVVIRVADDGRGLDAQKIKAKALERGLIAQGAELSAREIYALIFRPGFSTKEQVTDISGRGVGLEVVQRAVDELKGTIEIDSQAGKGTTFSITLPLSLSIIGGMVVMVDDRRYVIPISQLTETLDLARLRIESSTGTGHMVDLRGDVIPVYSLSRLLAPGRAERSKSTSESKAHRPAIVTSHRGRRMTFEVDAILAQQYVVLKRLGRQLSGLPGITAGAILSDGEPGLVLNLHELVPKEVTHAAS